MAANRSTLAATTLRRRHPFLCSAALFLVLISSLQFPETLAAGTQYECGNGYSYDCSDAGAYCTNGASCLAGTCNCNTCLIGGTTTGTSCAKCGGSCPYKGLPGSGCFHSGPVYCYCPDATPHRCGSSCVSRATDFYNCGSCGHVCQSGQTCQDSQCVSPCSGTMCNGYCVTLSSDINNCGRCGNACGSGRSCRNGACVCDSGSDCNGYCLNLSSDYNNCGACGNKCPNGQTCSGGKCTCSNGQTNCNGYCLSLDSDYNNCGACGNKCPNGQTCSGGRCVCSNGLTNCNGYCVDTKSDRNHCSACNAACSSDSTGCSNGQCQFAPKCSASQTNCGSLTSLNCVTLSSDSQNCGGCGNKCAGGKTCSGGQCVCPSGLTDCSGTCVDIRSDRNKCGSCSNVCPSSSTGCLNGVCQSAPVPPPPSPAPPVTTAPAAPTTVQPPPTTAVDAGFVAEPTSAPSIPASATSVQLPNSITIKSSSGDGMTCDPNCHTTSGAKGSYQITSGRNSVLLRGATGCLQAVRSSSTGAISVIEGSCPSSPAKRQTSVSKLPYWTLFSVGGVTKIMNANLDQQYGCLQPSAGSTIVVGSCSSAESGQLVIASADTSTTTGVPIGAIVGGVVGGLAVVGASSGAFYYVRRRNRNRDPGAESSELANDAKQQSVEQDGKFDGNKATDPQQALSWSKETNNDVIKSAALNPMEVPMSLSTLPGSVVYSIYGGDVTRNIKQVDVKTFSKASFGFDGSKPDELSFSPGVSIFVEAAFADGWALGTSAVSGQQGLFPADLLEIAAQQKEQPIPERVLAKIPGGDAILGNSTAAYAQPSKAGGPTSPTATTAMSDFYN